jgi:ABC-type Fe3+-hydroxamate transport system substrate-binding protein
VRWLVFMTLVACQVSRSPGETRVVSLHDVTSEIAVALGARLVGVAEPMEPPPAWAASLREVTRVDGLESILAVRPSHVLGLGVVGEQDPELVAALRARGVEVVLFDPRRLEDVDAMVARVAAISSTSALPAIGELRRPGGERRVFVYDCCDPPFTAGGATVLSDLVTRAGGRNLFAGLDADWTHVSWEAVVAGKPELIVVHDYVWGDQDDVPGKRAALARHGLGDVPVVVLPLPLSLGGLGSREAFERLAAAIGGP